MITSGAYTLTILLMFISGSHVTQEFKYDTLEQCNLEGAKSAVLIKTAYKQSKDIDVRALCKRTLVCDDCNKPVDLEKANKCERDCK